MAVPRPAGSGRSWLTGSLPRASSPPSCSAPPGVVLFAVTSASTAVAGNMSNAVSALNSRGVTSRGIYDSGAQEWSLAASIEAGARLSSTDGCVQAVCSRSWVML